MFSFPIIADYWRPRYSAPASFQAIQSYRIYINTSPLLYSLLSLLCLASLDTALGATAASALAQCPVQTCIDTSAFNANIDYFPVKVSSSQPDFTVAYYNSYKFIYNNLTNGAETVILYQCGSPVPSTLDNATVRIDSAIAPYVTNTTKFISVPVTRLAIDSSAGSVVTTCLELLGVRTAIKYLDTTYVTSPCIDTLAQQGNIIKYNATIHRNQVALVIGGNSALRLSNSVSVPVTLDTTMLARAGWIKFFALFFNREEAGLGLYNAMDHHYEQLSEAAMESTTKPVVAWVSSYQNSITISAYRNDLVTNAGGTPYQTSTGTTTTYTDINAFKAALLTVDAIVDESYYSVPPTNFTLQMINLGFNISDLNAATSPYRFIRNASVWRIDGRDSYNNAGDDWYESAIAEPDAVLADFVRVTQPSLPTPFNALTPPAHLWFRNVAANEPFYDIPLSACTDTSAPALLLFDHYNVSVSTLPSFTCPPFVSDATLFGGGKTLSGCPVLSCISTGNFNTSVDYFPVKSNSSVSDQWWVRYYNSYKFIYNNLTGTDESYVLYHCGSPVPSTTATATTNTSVRIDDSIAPYVSSTTKFFSVPVKRVGVDSSVGSVATTYLELLGVRTSIQWFDATYSSSACIDYLFDLSVIEPLTYFDAEYYHDLAESDIFLEGNSATSSNKGVSVAVTDSTSSLLSYTNWLNFLALFFNKEAIANALYSTMTTNLANLRQQSASVASRPTVAWVNYLSYTNPVQWIIAQSIYRQDITISGGASYLNATTTSFTDVTLFKQALLTVDTLIDETYHPLPPSFLQTYMTLGFTEADVQTGSPYKFLVNRRLFRIDGRKSADFDGDDWVETRIANPDAVLADFLRVSQPSLSTPFSGKTPSYLWFRNVAANETVTALGDGLMCQDPSAPVLPLYNYYNVSLSSLPSYTCPAYLLNPAVYNGNGDNAYSSSSSTGGGNNNGAANVGVNGWALVVAMIGSIMLLA